MRLKKRLIMASIFITTPALGVSANQKYDSSDILQVGQLISQPTYGDVDVSPDGAWVAYLYIPSSGGGVRTRLIELATERVIDLSTGENDNVQYAGWSPDSRYLAFNSNRGGRAALWIWDRTSQRIRPVSGAMVRSLGTKVSWFPDSRRLVALLWPEGMRAQAATPEASSAPRTNAFRPPFGDPDGNGASLYVYRANLPGRATQSSEGEHFEGGGTTGGRCNNAQGGECDIGIIDVPDGSVTRIVRSVRTSYFYEPSPDGRIVAYSTYGGVDPATNNALFEIRTFQLENRVSRTIAAGIPMAGGGQFSWAPDSSGIAVPRKRHELSAAGNSNRNPTADIALFPVDGSNASPFPLPDSEAISGTGRVAWSTDSTRLYAVDANGRLWEILRSAAQARIIGEIDGHRITRVIEPNEGASLTDRAATSMLWVEAQTRDGQSTGLFEVDTGRGGARLLMERPQRGFGVGSDTSRARGEFVFLSQPGQQPRQVVLWRPRSGRDRIIADNPFAHVRFGEVQLVHWDTAAGQRLSGALMLPPNYRPGSRLPLVVWVYGGHMGSQYVNLFGFSDSNAFNMQMLATRGYAVLYPDVPQSLGNPLNDIVNSVLPGIDRLVSLGIADADRIAVMGQSYGSYSTLALITHSNRFKAAVISGVAHPDLLSNYLRMNSDGSDGVRWTENGQGLMGVPLWQDAERYRRNSPIYSFDRIQTPLLIGEGELDVAQGVFNANAVFVALRRLGKPVEYRLYEGDGHVISRPSNLLDFWNRRLSFLAENLNIALDEQGRIIMENGRAKAPAPNVGRQSPSN